MATYGIDFILTILLCIFQLAIVILFSVLYAKKKYGAFLALIASISIFILGNILSAAFFKMSQSLWLEFFRGLLSASGLVPIVIFLEIFENGVPFTQRSSISIIIILVIGALRGAEYAFPENVGNFIAFMSPMIFILVGVFYLDTIKKIKHRIRFENQKKKLRKVRSGIYLTFIIPKFFIGSLIMLPVLPKIIDAIIPGVSDIMNYDVSFLYTAMMTHIFDVILNLFQTLGIIIMSIPIFYSQSVFFMQSRKVSRLITINDDGIPIFEFNFEIEEDITESELLPQAYAVISTLLKRGSSSNQQLKTINYGNLVIMTEIRNNYATLLIVDKPTKFLEKALKAFTDDIVETLPKNAKLNQIRIQKLKYSAEKLIQKNFGLEKEEFEQIKAIVSDGYDRMHRKYLKKRLKEDEGIKLLPDFIKRLPVGSRVLDAGCGAGEPVTRILSEKFKVTGVDISKKQVDIARGNLPYCEFIWQDMTTLTFPDEYFDGIVSYHSIQHIPREEHKTLLENFYRMLKPKGLTLLCFATSDDPGKVIDDFFGVKMYWSSFDAGTNIEMLKEVGFHIIWIKLVFDNVTESQNLFVLAKKAEPELYEEAKEEGIITITQNT